MCKKGDKGIKEIMEIADKGYQRTIRDNRTLARGLNLHKGKITYNHVVEAFNMDYKEISF